MARLLFLTSCFVLAGLPFGSSLAADGPTSGTDALRASLQIAYDGLQRIQDSIQDYTCTLTRRERIGGRLMDHETMLVKVRHQQKRGERIVEPFSVYVRFLSPERVRGREVIYVEGRHDGKIIVRNGGLRFAHITTSLPPDSPVAMHQSRYPMTEIGLLNLTRRLIENGERELQNQACRAQLVRGAKVNGRPSTLIQVSHTSRQSDLQYKMARILIDDELILPVHYAAYDWPQEDGEAPLLLEEYTYTDIRLNVGLTDRDFDHRNEAYQFLKSYSP